MTATTLLFLLATLERPAYADFGSGMQGFSGIGSELPIVAGVWGAANVVLPFVVAELYYAFQPPGKRRMPVGWRIMQSFVGTALIPTGAWMTFAAANYDIGAGTITVQDGRVTRTGESWPFMVAGVSMITTGAWFIGHAVYHWIDPLWVAPKTSACRGGSFCWDF